MSKLEVDKLTPQSGTSLTLGDSGDTFTVPTGASLVATDELKTNKISPSSGTSFTFGDSGDTFTVPSGATITNNGTATGFGLTNWSESSGNLLASNASYGIYLGVNSATAANLLNDYEEGTWTPVFLGGSGNPTINYTSQVGDYTKIGNLVYVQAYILINTTSGGSGNLRVGGLPFTAKNSGARGFASIALGNVISTIYATQLIDGNQTYSILRKDTSGQPVAEVQVSDLANSEYLWYSGVYHTD